MNKRLIGVALAALLAVIGTIAILAYVNDADDRARADVDLVEVFVIEDRVRAGSDEATVRGAIGTAEVIADTVVDGVLTDLTQLDGKVAAVDLVPGEQVLLSRLIDAASYSDGRSRLTSVPEGLHEVTVSLDPERIVGGQVVPGDTVGVVATFGPTSLGLDYDSYATTEELLTALEAFAEIPKDVPGVEVTHFILNKVLVTRVQVEELPVERTDADGNPIDDGAIVPTGNLLITLALDSEGVQELVFSMEKGSVWMTYEGPEVPDHDDDLDGTHRGNVFGHPHSEGDGEELLVVDETEAAS